MSHVGEDDSGKSGEERSNQRSRRLPARGSVWHLACKIRVSEAGQGRAGPDECMREELPCQSQGKIGTGVLRARLGVGACTASNQGQRERTTCWSLPIPAQESQWAPLLPSSGTSRRSRKLVPVRVLTPRKLVNATAGVWVPELAAQHTPPWKTRLIEPEPGVFSIRASVFYSKAPHTRSGNPSG